MEYLLKENTSIISPKPRKQSIDSLQKEINDSIKDKKVIFLGLCGGHASGKTKIAKYFKKNVRLLSIISEKDFFKARKRRRSSSTNEKTPEDNGYSVTRIPYLTDLSNPECYEHDKLFEYLNRIKNGEKVSLPKFDEERMMTIEDAYEVDPKETPIILVEGCFIFKNEKIRSLFHFKMYVEVDDDVRLSRLMLRENDYIKNNSNALQDFLLVYEKHIKVSFEQNIKALKSFANINFQNYEVDDHGDIETQDYTFHYIINGLNYYR